MIIKSLNFYNLIKEKGELSVPIYVDIKHIFLKIFAVMNYFSWWRSAFPKKKKKNPDHSFIASNYNRSKFVTASELGLYNTYEKKYSLVYYDLLGFELDAVLLRILNVLYFLWWRDKCFFFFCRTEKISGWIIVFCKSTI